MNKHPTSARALALRGLYWVSWLNLLGAAVLLAALLSFGADWPQVLEMPWLLR